MLRSIKRSMRASPQNRLEAGKTTSPAGLSASPSTAMLGIGLILALMLPASGAIMPDQFAGYIKSDSRELATPAADRALFTEYGLQETEAVTYTSATEADPLPEPATFTVEAWRLRDPTGAMALFQYLRPETFEVSELTDLAVTSGQMTLVGYGNHLFRFTGRAPSGVELEDLSFQLARLDESSLPTIARYLPPEDAILGSGRYLGGPVALARFLPQVPPSVAAFSQSAEGEVARYETPSGPLTLAIFQYPTPGIAREQYEKFLALPDVRAKRTGPLVAVIPGSADPDEAEIVLGRVEYQASISWDEPMALDPREELMGWGNVIITGFILAGAIGVVGLFAGLGLGGLRALSKKMGWHQEYDALTVLQIHDQGTGNPASQTTDQGPSKP